MVVYSIKDIENLSGIKAHTLRIWEKRFNILTPRRTETNIRYYLTEDLQKILNIALLNKNGYKISQIAGMGEDEISKTVAALTDVDVVHEGNIDGLVLSMFELNESKFNSIIEKHIEADGIEKTMNEVIYPFLDKLSTMWFTGSIKGVHESFVSYIIRRKLVAAIDRIKPDKSKLKAIIYLPEGETQELSLLYLHYILRKNGVDVLNLGNFVPLIEVIEAQQIFKSKYIFTFFNDSFTETPLQTYIDEIGNYLKECKIYISGYQTIVQSLTLPSNMSIMGAISDVKAILESQDLIKNN